MPNWHLKIVGRSQIPATRAVSVNVEIMRAFVLLRRTLESTDGLARKLEALERKYDGQFAHVFEAIRQLVAPPKGGIKKIGFKAYRETHRRDRAQWGARCQPSVLRPRRHNDN